ncbi:hypothetical protein [Paeniglutamicibacter terrestris]|uniref:Uncharacterized protein n=1 Tax=Paeniglutamicibacter terrestris TaxID=2723403 RepID=A0ABX1G4A4_9MICC|nr:hypothetical protein [Paeniglutamicibacter terrestris]NKG21070.1 hypothetical protein [Paeniglutamicibacter terrestris]
MSKPKPAPAAEPVTDPRIMFDGYKWRIVTVASRTHALSFFEREDAVKYLEAQDAPCTE